MDVGKNAIGLNRTASITLLAAMCALAVGCGGGDPGDDQVTLGTGQGQGSDPATLDFPIFYVKRPAPDPMDPTLQPSNVLELRQFEPGADLFMRDRASPSATEVNLTGQLTQDLGDVRDVNVSWDGTKVVFALRFPYDPNINNEEDQPASWDIYEYDIPTQTLRGLVVDPLRTDPDAPRYDDRFPHYLPNGRIVFTSNRQRISQAVLLDEGKSQYQAQDENNNEPAFVLHVMDEDGGNIDQLSYNQSHDMYPAVLPNGQLVFSRWDGARAPDAVNLYRMNPDGTGLELLYGRQNCTHLITNANISCTSNTTTPIQFLSPRPLSNGRLLALVRPFSGTEDGGDLVTIDIDNYVEYSQPTLPNVGVLNGPGHTRVPPVFVSTEPNTASVGGRYRSVYPLGDNSNRLLVSWSQCRLIENQNIVPCTSQRMAMNPPLQAAPPLYGIYIYDLNQNTQLPIVVPVQGTIYSDVVAAASLTLPPSILDRIPGVDYAASLASQAVGILDIKSVYDFDGADRAPGGIAGVSDPQSANFAQRPARFLRIEKAVSLPNNDVRNIRGTSFSPVGRFMREIIGYTPIEPDGSVRVKVPANVALRFSIVDENARRVVAPNAQGFFSPQHNNWIQVRPGEILTCNGCHTPQQAAAATPQSHGRTNLFASANGGAPAGGIFPNTDPALWGNPGETMAQIRAQRMCALNNGSSACGPNSNVIFDDLWPTAGNKAASFDYCYASGITDVANDAADSTLRHTCQSRLDTAPPTTDSCRLTWSSSCRIVINYVEHIQPLWDLSRPAGGADNQCVGCHSPQDAMGAPRVPAGQLDLTATPDANQADHLTSYRKLLFAHNAQQLNATMTALEDVCVQFDATTGVCTQFQVVSAPMNALNARGSRFFTAINNATHAGMMTNAELRLISEWLDIGAQYYNDPFDAPEN